ncbi:30S ribosomal protein S2 [Microgenomates group bacterium RBG_19FT_COMBO_39_10]|nr:MAG: 30S ribosomal protein S2 [Microgenomates group bacterium RBG_19FT_COMBO_39_10]
MATKLSLKDLLEAGAHFGHQARRWNPKMEDYLFEVRDGIHVFDLVKTKEGLEKAADFVRELTAQGGQIIFVGTKRQAQAIIKEEAKKAGMPFVDRRWLGGTVTNWQEIKKRIDHLIEMREQKEKGEYKKYTKKEQLLLDREMEKLEKKMGGLVSLEDLPAAIFMVDTKTEEIAIREAKMKDIPVVAIVDSNSNPDLVDYLIPANDDAVGAIKLIVSIISEAARSGREAWQKKASEKKKETS